MPRFARHHLAALLAALYGLVSALWILISDHVVRGISRNALQLTQMQSYKGWVFVLISTVIVYALLKAGQRSRLRSESAARVARTFTSRKSTPIRPTRTRPQSP